MPYDFNETDFRISLALINTYLGKALTGSGTAAAGDAIPWATLSYLIGEAMYGESCWLRLQPRRCPARPSDCVCGSAQWLGANENSTQCPTP